MTRAKKSNFIIYAAALLSFIFTGLFGVMVLNTFVLGTPPLMPAGALVSLSRAGDLVWLNETRHYKGSTTDSIQVQRHIYQQNSSSYGYIIEGGFIGAESSSEARRPDGTFTVKRTLALPPGAQGRWCSGADIIWYPVLSLKAHRFETEDICFDIAAEGEPSKMPVRPGSIARGALMP